MGKNHKMNRRKFLHGQIAIATVGVCGTAFASEPTRRLEGRASLKPGAIEKQPWRAPSWETGTADEFNGFINQPFKAIAQDGSTFFLTLVEVEAGNSGPARPKNLARAEGVSLIFKSDFAADLAEQGHQTVTISHATLGEFKIFLGAVPRKSGKYDVEAILN